MKLSIITPSYNQAPYIGTCLNSVAKQTHVDLEHIVVDGGSTDSTASILLARAERDPRLTFTSERDRGQGDAVNRGFAKATGEVIAWINSDDYYFDDLVFADVVRLFEANPAVDVIYGGMAYVDDSDNLMHVRVPPEFDYGMLTRIAYIGNTNAFVRRTVVERHQINIAHHFVLDHEFMLRVTRDFSTMRTERIIACFRVHPAAKTQTLAKEVKDRERASRDADLGIRRDWTYLVRQLCDRLWFRLALRRSDAALLPQFRKRPPYKAFLESPRRPLA